MKIFGIAYFTLLATNALIAAAPVQTPGTKLLVCIDRGSFLGSCKLTNLELAPSQTFEAELSITYKFPCRGPAVEFKARAQTSPNDANAVADYPIAFTNESKTINAVGYGPFKILDTNPIKTQNRPFDKMCDLTIENLAIKASPATKEKWTGDLASLNSLLDAYEDNVKSWGALAVLEPAFTIYDNLIKNVSVDFSNTTDLLNASKELLTCTDGTTDEGCETVIDKIIDAKTLLGLSEDEGKKLSKLQKTLNNADFSGVLSCENAEGGNSCVAIDQFLKKYLTADDISKLSTAREKLKAVVGAKDKLSTYEALMISTEDSIARLAATMKEYE